ncbi:MAG: hypothetical protein AUK47_27495 [Deltaproteobacteria bacterium CG2_30_63_29]|nr:MAG: hypothetical protein AUK47_27495 [Deltaproteobacteria bacterium CG2_30_63_29]PJB39847.1 MAG: hypothetical protein CO108_16235 [Deltaproteobacteria bacterium CG_4_9_14_3_um_filter_63_12]
MPMKDSSNSLLVAMGFPTDHREFFPKLLASLLVRKAFWKLFGAEHEGDEGRVQSVDGSFCPAGDGQRWRHNDQKRPALAQSMCGRRMKRPAPTLLLVPPELCLEDILRLRHSLVLEQDDEVGGVVRRRELGEIRSVDSRRSTFVWEDLAQDIGSLPKDVDDSLVQRAWWGHGSSLCCTRVIGRPRRIGSLFFALKQESGGIRPLEFALVVGSDAVPRRGVGRSDVDQSCDREVGRPADQKRQSRTFFQLQVESRVPRLVRRDS